MEAMPRPAGRLIWLHAASVGETISVLPVLSALATLAPDATMLLTTGTTTSANLLNHRLPELGLATRVLHRFAPLDVPAWVMRFLDHWRPNAACFVEGELWPNTLNACDARAIPAILINARMSARSHAAWRWLPGVADAILNRFVRIYARGEEDASRLRGLGGVRVEVAGDLKLAAPVLPVDPAILRDLSESLAGRPVFLAASTHPGEEVLISGVHNTLRSHYPGLLTIIAPRHPHRGADLAMSLNAPRRKSGEPPPADGIWIADTLGELGVWYRLCHVAFIGRSLISPGGGQNPLEPARLGCATVTGPFTNNFTDHVALLRAAGGLQVADGMESLTSFVNWMLADPVARRQMGERAKAAVTTSGELPDKTARSILRLMDGD